MDDDGQLSIPPSFAALYRDARGRMTVLAAEFRARYELCEDMAQMLAEPSRARVYDLGLSEDLVLARTRAGLAAEGGGFSEAEAHWVATRLAELLGWDWAEAMPTPAR